NCALGASEMRPYVEALAGVAPTFVSCHPNAGLPDGFEGFTDSVDHMTKVVTEFARNGWLNILGGCCGTTPQFIRRFAESVEGVAPRVRPRSKGWASYSGLEPLVVRPDSNFLMIGERTNITGSKRFARLIKSGRYEEALTVAREQVENGA